MSSTTCLETVETQLTIVYDFIIIQLVCVFIVTKDLSPYRFPIEWGKARVYWVILVLLGDRFYRNINIM